MDSIIKEKKAYSVERIAFNHKHVRGARRASAMSTARLTDARAALRRSRTRTSVMSGQRFGEEDFTAEYAGNAKIIIVIGR